MIIGFFLGISTIILIFSACSIIYDKINRKKQITEQSLKQTALKKLPLQPIEKELLQVISSFYGISLGEIIEAYRHTIYIDPLIICIEKAKEENIDLNEYVKQNIIEPFQSVSWN